MTTFCILKFRNCAIRGAVSIFVILLSGKIHAQVLEIPLHYIVRDSVSGDLTKDSIKELAVVFNTGPDTSENGVARELIIYKLNAGAWKIWKRSTQAVYGSKGGGMMGDPYEKMDIKKNTLRISQYGGSAWKWSVTDIYRYQNSEFYLIGYDSYSGRLCEAFTDMSFNLNTGKIIASRTIERCNDAMEPLSKKIEKETWQYTGLSITLQNRNSGTIIIISPKNNWEFYLSLGQD